MDAAETRHDLWLKRINTWIGILGGSVASIAGAYNFLPSFFPAAPGDIAAIVREQGGAVVPRAQDRNRTGAHSAQMPSDSAAADLTQHAPARAANIE